MKHRATPWVGCLLFGFVTSSAGCRPESHSPISLLVLDAFDEPPQEGFALLVRSSGWSNGNAPLTVEAVSDTLHWDALTGYVVPPTPLPAHARWFVASPDPVDSGSWRHVLHPVEGQDTLRLSVSVPYWIRTRLGRTVGATPTGYSLVVESLEGEITLEEWPHEHLQRHCAGQLEAKSFPLTLHLRRHRGPDLPPLIVASKELDYQGSTTRLVAHWSDVNDFREKP